MVIAVRIRVTGIRETQMLFNKLPESTRTEVGNAMFDYAKIVRDNMRKEIYSGRHITSSRIRAARLIKAQQLSRIKSVVKIPQKLMFLDVMRPHYVSLKRGRAIMRWVRKHYGTRVVSGKSRVRKGPRGGITGGFLYVTPHPFVNKALIRSRRRLPTELRKGIRKAFRKARGG